MKARAHYVRERNLYSEQYVRELLGNSAKRIEALEKIGILDRRTKSDKKKMWSELADDLGGLDEEAENLTSGYVFHFVGVVCVGGYILKCYPKYMKPGLAPLQELKQLIQVIEKAASGKDNIVRDYAHEQNSEASNLLSLMMYFLNDYYENGLYRNELNTLEINGDGEIVWDKTINETYPIISNGQPYYFELYTKKRIRDNSDFFYRLHSCILTRICRELEEAELIELLGIVPVELSEEELADFGDTEYIIDRIDKELGVQFNTRKQNLLMAMRDYLNQQGSLNDENILTLYGTGSFHTVWEKVCAKVFDNVLNEPLSSVAQRLGVPLATAYNPSTKLKELMPKPVWSWPGLSEDKELDDTLRLDLISANAGKFIIFDAKYYTPQISSKGKLYKTPGIGDVTKQYFYQLAYMPFLKAHGLDAHSVRNCFLMPMQYYKDPDGDFRENGKASISMFHEFPLEYANMQDIQVRYLHPQEVYAYYLSGENYPIEELNL